MVIGGSGSGKTRNYVKPNLMQLNASYFLTDPKGTSLPECGYLFRDNGYRIKVFNTIEFNKSMHYNPLKYVKTDADILSFVNCLISNTNGDKQSGGDPLIDAAEIGKMNRREAILLIAGTNPLKDLKYPVEQHPNYIYLDPGRNKPGQVKNRCLYDEPFNILEYMDEIRTKDDTYAS